MPSKKYNQFKNKSFIPTFEQHIFATNFLKNKHLFIGIKGIKKVLSSCYLVQQGFNRKTKVKHYHIHIINSLKRGDTQCKH